MTEINEHSKLVAEIEVVNPIAFNTQMGDVISTEDDTPPEETNENPPVELPRSEETPPEETPEETLPEETPPEETPAESPYKDYSEAALVAEALRKKRPDVFKEEVNKDLAWENIIEKIDGYISETVENAKEYQMQMLGESKEYVDFLLKGGDPKVVEKAMENVQYSKLNVEEASEEQLEEVVNAMYQSMGLPGDEAKSLIETAKLGDKLKERATQAVGRFAQEEKDILENAKRQQKLQEEQSRARIEQTIAQMNSIIDKGEILGFQIDDNEKQRLRDAFLSPTEIVEVPDGRGGMVTKKFTKYQVLEAEFKNSIEQQIAFGKLLLDGFKLNNIKETVKKETHDDIIKALQSKGAVTETRRGTNAYLAPNAEYDV